MFLFGEHMVRVERLKDHFGVWRADKVRLEVRNQPGGSQFY